MIEALNFVGRGILEFGKKLRFDSSSEVLCLIYAGSLAAGVGNMMLKNVHSDLNEIVGLCTATVCARLLISHREWILQEIPYSPVIDMTL